MYKNDESLIVRRILSIFEIEFAALNKLSIVIKSRSNFFRSKDFFSYESLMKFENALELDSTNENLIMIGKFSCFSHFPVYLSIEPDDRRTSFS